MTMRRYGNSFTITGIASLLLAGFVANYLRRIPFSSLQAGLGPAFFPTIVVALLVVLGSMALLVGIVRTRRHADAGDIEPFSRRTTVLVPVVILYAFGIQVLGLLIPTAVFLMLSMVALGVRVRNAVIATILASTAIYLLFGLVFRIGMFF
jgi:hypothetical protein